MTPIVCAECNRPTTLRHRLSCGTGLGLYLLTNRLPRRQPGLAIRPTNQPTGRHRA